MAKAKPERIDMNKLLAEITANLGFKFKESGTKVSVEDMPACFADKTHVTQIFTNLLDNAVKYLAPGRPGQIRVGGEVKGEQVVYFVEDNGVGIAPEHQEKIFEIFFRLGDKTTGGEGIGLTMVKRMVGRNNGKIWVESQPGKGSKFFVGLDG
jgi:signal transduction histidine kinase